MKKSQVLNCVFSSWYPRFKNVTIKSEILPVPQDFVDYLHSDESIMLPEAGEIEPGASNTSGEQHFEEPENPKKAATPNFTSFESDIKMTIESLGGSIFPKLNWSSPKDACWISFDKTLRCTCPSDIYLLLKSSDFVTHDLTQPFIECDDHIEGDENDVKYELVLRRWLDVDPSMEFRCFVRENQLLGICQRDPSSFYPHLKQRKNMLLSEMLSFYQNNIQGKFVDSSFVFDVYQIDDGKLLVLDFNPFGEVTDGLLFNWEELMSEELKGNCSEQGPELRLVEEGGISAHPYQTYAVPQDVVDLASGTDPNKLIDFLQMQIQSQELTAISDDEQT